MNTLSWMIYASELCQSVGSACVTLVLLSLAFGAICWGATFMHADTLNLDEGDAVKAKGARILRACVMIAIPAAVIGVIVPSQKTVLMIAASEAGQRVYDDPTNQPVISALRDAITAKLREVSK